MTHPLTHAALLACGPAAAAVIFSALAVLLEVRVLAVWLLSGS